MSETIHAKAVAQVESAFEAQKLNVVGILGATAHTTTEDVILGVSPFRLGITVLSKQRWQCQLLNELRFDSFITLDVSDFEFISDVRRNSNVVCHQPHH